MVLDHLASVGDVIETNVRLPVPGRIRVELATPEACATANNILMSGGQGWRLIKAHNEGRGDER